MGDLEKGECKLSYNYNNILNPDTIDINDDAKSLIY